LRGIIEFFADLPTNLEQPFDLLLHRGRFSPFQFRWVSSHRHDRRNVRRQLSSRGKYATQLGGVDPVIASESPGCLQSARVNSAPFDCPDFLAASLRFNIGRPPRQGDLPRNVSEPA
jgi:hypothetical protein